MLLFGIESLVDRTPKGIGDFEDGDSITTGFNGSLVDRTPKGIGDPPIVSK